MAWPCWLACGHVLVASKHHQHHPLSLCRTILSSSSFHTLVSFFTTFVALSFLPFLSLFSFLSGLARWLGCLRPSRRYASYTLFPFPRERQFFFFNDSWSANTISFSPFDPTTALFSTSSQPSLAFDSRRRSSSHSNTQNEKAQRNRRLQPQEKYE